MHIGERSEPIRAAKRRLDARSSECERDSSGTTEAGETREGDGADSPTRASNSLCAPLVRGLLRSEAARPKHYNNTTNKFKKSCRHHHY
jgi:hypothetical protein